MISGIGINGIDTLKVIKAKGKVKDLRSEVQTSLGSDLANDDVLDTHVGIAHTRWATHGVPSQKNSHPQSSDIDNTFIVVHNGESIFTHFLSLRIHFKPTHYFLSPSMSCFRFDLLLFLFFLLKKTSNG